MPSKRRRGARPTPPRKAVRQKTPAEQPKAPATPAKKPSAKKRAPSRGRGLLRRRYLLLALLLIGGWAFLVRCLHLFEPGHDYIVSADSYLFHWMADRVMDGQSIPTDVQPSGLAYPLAYGANAVGWVFGMSDQDALTFVCKYLPPLIAVLTAVLIYFALSRMYDRRMGLCCALAWAVLPHAYFIQAAGYLDRDAINVPLILLGVLAFFFSKRWHLGIKERDVGWVVGALIVLAVELILFIEWSWVGPGLLLTIIVAYFLVDLAVKALSYAGEAYSIEQSFLGSVWLRLREAVKETAWKPFLVILGLNIVVALVNWDTAATTLREIGDLLRPGGGQIAELQGLTLADFKLFEFFILLVPIGFFLAVVRHREGDLLFLTWFGVLLVLSFFSRRLILYMTPAAAILGGMVVASLWDFQYAKKREKTIQKVVGIVVVLVMVGLAGRAYSVATGARVSANTAWCNGLTYVSQESPQDSRVMSWWDYGYWILDLGDRRPVVDGGLYGHTGQQDSDVGLVYCTDNASEAVEIMEKYHAEYVIFSRLERDILPVIASYAFGSDWSDWWNKWQNGQDNSLYRRSLYGGFVSEGRLERVYPASDVRYPEVVVLHLKE